MEREVSLLPGQAGMRVRSRIVNRSKTPRRFRPHWFVLFRAGEMNDIHFFKRAPDGSLADLANGMRAGTDQEQWVNLSGRNVPFKLWGFFNPKLTIGMSETVGRAIEFFGSNGHLHTVHVLTETRLKPITLKPGASVAYERTYRIFHEKPL